MRRTQFTFLALLALSGMLAGCGRGFAIGSQSSKSSQGSGSGQPTQGSGSGSTSGSGSGSGSGTPTGPTAYSGVQMVTWHDDNARTGLNSNEITLTPNNVNASTFGKLFSYDVDGHIYAQPLYLSNVPIGATLHNVVYVATEYDSVYAFDADNAGDGSPLWKTSLLRTGETPFQAGNPKPWIGITSTPVIDVTSKTMWVVSEHKGGIIRLNSLNIETGAIQGSVNISASVPSTLPEAVNGQLQLTSACLQRAGLLLTGGTVYIGFGGCPHGWLLAYDAATLKQTAVFCSSPNQDGYGPYPGGGGIWGGGAGPASDDQGNIFVTTGDGPNDDQTEWGESVLRLDTTLRVRDYFTPDDWSFLQCKDSDLGSAGAMLAPGRDQVVAGGKNGLFFVLNQNSLGQKSTNDSAALSATWYGNSTYPSTCTTNTGQLLTETIGSFRVYGTAAWFNGSIYIGGDPGPVKQYQLQSDGSLTLASQGPTSFALNGMGATTSVSSNGTTNGIVWAIDHVAPVQVSGGGAAKPAVLHAYDANDLSHELYNSAQNAADTAGLGVKFTAPTVANGKVFVGGAKDDYTVPNPQGELDVYGLLPQPRS